MQHKTKTYTIIDKINGQYILYENGTPKFSTEKCHCFTDKRDALDTILKIKVMAEEKRDFDPVLSPNFAN